MRRWSRFLVVGVLWAVCARPHGQASIPARIVSTSPSITETLFALGLGGRVVGVSTYCRFPAEVARLPRARSVTGVSCGPTERGDAAVPVDTIGDTQRCHRVGPGRA